jgi:hypothetical protein
VNSSVDPITALVVLLFSTPGAALGFAGGLVLLALGLMVYTGYFEHRPLLEGLYKRINTLHEVSGSGMSVQQAFAIRFPDIDKIMGSSLTAPPTLILGWSSWRSLLVRDDDGRFATSVRAADVFGRFDEPARSLEWWANIFVAVGLTITFLGIVAALTQATSTMTSSGGSAAMQQALLGLLAIAATKFWTSIAGVLSSIILRLFARRWRQRIERAEAEFFSALDSLVVFAPPEKVALEQAAVLRRIEAALTAYLRQTGAAPAAELSA